MVVVQSVDVDDLACLYVGLVQGQTEGVPEEVVRREAEWDRPIEVKETEVKETEVNGTEVNRTEVKGIEVKEIEDNKEKRAWQISSWGEFRREKGSAWRTTAGDNKLNLNSQ
jgi:hypothetical protein